MRLLLVNYTTLHAISHRFPVISRSIGQIIAFDRGRLFQCARLVFSNPVNIAINQILSKARFFGLYVCRTQYWSSFNYFDEVAF